MAPDRAEARLGSARLGSASSAVCGGRLSHLTLWIGKIPAAFSVVYSVFICALARGCE